MKKMRNHFLMIGALAIYAAQIAGAQTTTIGGATVSPAVRDTIKAAGAAIGMEFKLNADNITSAEFWGN